MSNRKVNQNYQNDKNIPYSVKTVHIASPLYIPTQVYTTVSNPPIYTFDSTNQNYNISQAKTINVPTNNYPHTIYYSNPQYTTNSKIITNVKYTTNTQTYGTSINNQTVRTGQNYGYYELKGKKQQEVGKNINNNIIYMERPTNYPQTTALNLNNIYNQNNTSNLTNISNNNKNKNNIVYHYDNNSMHLVQSGYNATQKQKIQETNAKQIDPKSYYYNNQQKIITQNIQQRNTKTNNNTNTYINTNTNTYINTNTNANTNTQTNTHVNTHTNTTTNTHANTHTNTSTSTNTHANTITNNNTNIHTNISNVNYKMNKNNINNINNINNQTNTYNQTISNNTNNKANNSNIAINYNKYNPQQNIINSNIYKENSYLVTEPIDNKKKKINANNTNNNINNNINNINNNINITKNNINNTNNNINTNNINNNNNIEHFNKTMPNLKTNQKMEKVSYTLNNSQVKSSHTNQVISNFEISFNNTRTKHNNVPVKTNNITISDNENNKQNIKTEKQDENVEYVDQFGNKYIMINGEYIDKRTLANNINTVEKNSKSYLNKDNVYYEEDDNINQAQIPNINNTNKQYYDTYTNVQNNNQLQNVVINNAQKNEERKYHDMNLKRIKDEFNLDYKDNDNFNNTYPIKGQKVYKTENLINNNTIKNQDQNIDQRNNRFKQEPNYNNINVNYNMNVSQNQNMNNINNIIINNKVNNNNQLKDNDIQIIEPQKPKSRRPVYKIPPSKKRAVSQGRSLGFIHKYYDENFILEEDNEDIASDSENKKKNHKRLKKIFREVINIKRLIPQWQELKRINNENNRMEHNENIIIKSEEQNNIENTNKDSNVNNTENVNIQQRNQNMRLSHLRFTLETSNTEENKIKKNIDNNVDNDLNSNNNEENKDNEIDNNINIDEENNNLIKSVIIPNTQIESELDEHSQNELESKVIVDSNMSGPQNSDSVIEKKSLLDENSNNNSQNNNNNNQNHYKKLTNIGVDSSSYNPSMIKESNMSIDPDFYEPQETNIKESIKKSNISLEENKNKETDEDKRISLNIAGHDLDKYFEKEGINKRDSSQMEVSNSLKTINLNDDGRNSRFSRISLTEEQKDNLKNSQAKSTVSNNGNNEDVNDGNQLLTLDDALKGSVHIPENIKDFVSKNNELYNNDNDNENKNTKK